MNRYIKFSPLLLLIPVLIFLYFYHSGEDQINIKSDLPVPAELKNKWKDFSGGREGKIIYAEPPSIFVVYLHTGIKKKINGIRIEGGRGRWKRGKTPRPFWSKDGSIFVYRYSGSIYIADETGKKKAVENKRMDTSKETRWSIIKIKGENYIFGPSKDRTGIAVNINDPSGIIELFPYPVIDKHCELTRDGKYIVYNNGSDIFVAQLASKNRGIKISSGQNCRPCASPGKYAAWLPAPHFKYNLHDVINGKFVKELKAPENEEIYRLNWSNDEEFAVHMFGSRGNTRIHIRKISNGGSLFIGNGWDPDLWVAAN